ncbi:MULTISPECIES: DUF2238 domain-containing protein [unclassified Bacillus (in: firmicutes)]|uniref:DUF2238 domain-containing protein n=1 Tax=unclassified Bacillus (in: firmicutes) TaxID=185979 RepID=UPI0008EC9E1E|nr:MULTISPECIES: DUF2238 domain-containing protein [unclassified Bacillus (in: firmicutes)]SFA77843.1 putative membrane protein [Bacillus sp. UNCCL13]SFQ67726.1 putative membrane protein [Bacillus sp. cl95]
MSNKRLIGIFILFLFFLIWSGIRPADRFTWWLEVLPALIGVAALIFTYRKFKFTSLAYILIFIHCVILIVGGHYTYAEMPLFNMLKDMLDLDRNYYDRLGHLAQGFIPSIIVREILWKTSPLRENKWLPFIVVCICLAFSATYELIEFTVAVMTGEAAEAFLGTQGDVWDTQWDMLLALIGAITAYFTLHSIHNEQLKSQAPSI